MFLNEEFMEEKHTSFMCEDFEISHSWYGIIKSGKYNGKYVVTFLYFMLLNDQLYQGGKDFMGIHTADCKNVKVKKY
jgi:hypothetical protein